MQPLRDLDPPLAFVSVAFVSVQIPPSQSVVLCCTCRLEELQLTHLALWSIEKKRAITCQIIRIKNMFQ